MNTPYGWARGCLLADGAYSGVDVAPNTLAEKIVLCVNRRQQLLRVIEIELLAHAPARTKSVAGLLQEYLSTALPEMGQLHKRTKVFHEFLIKDFDSHAKRLMSRVEAAIQQKTQGGNNVAGG